jgi:nucleotidyltransferase/DNA polymerase involved in DNA repair
MGAAFVEILPIGKFHGVGPVTADKMNRLGILTGADLRKQSLAFLQQHFGRSGPWYHAIANGEDDRPVVPNRPRPAPYDPAVQKPLPRRTPRTACSRFYPKGEIIVRPGSRCPHRRWRGG